MLAALIDAAYEYAYPLYAMAATRYHAVQDGGNPRRHAPNTWQHERRLADHTARWITAPNNDTLYSNAWVDLAAGPVTLQVAAMPAGRYWSVALMDGYTNHFALLGQRLDGIGPVTVTLVGPDHAGALPAGRSVRAPGHDVWLFARCLVDGPGDMPNAFAMQDCLGLTGPAGVQQDARVVPVAPTDPANFLAVINEMLGRNPPPAEDAALLRDWAAIGVRPGDAAAWTQLDAATQQVWQARIDACYAALTTAGTRGRRNVQGWITAGPEIGNFGRNYALRASVAHGGLGALEPVEATYFVRFHDAAGQLLDGTSDQVLHVPASGIPTDSFWSFTMYEPVEGRRWLVDNPIRRYSIGNRTPGLVYNADGSLDIALTHAEPVDARLRANWLPAPAGPFQISLRCYLPRPALRAGEALMPQIVPLDERA